MLVLDGVEYLVEKEASARYGRSIHWFRKARSTLKSFPYHRLNGKVYYSSEGLNRWFKENLKPVLL